MVGSSILRLLKKKNFSNVIFKSRKQLNLLEQTRTFSFLKKNKPDVVIIAAAKVGGIQANNTLRAEFLYQNLQIQNNLIHGSFLANVKKVIFLGSSCIYPKYCKQPIKEDYLLNGKLEETNEPYAIAKIAGLKMIENYKNQYGKSYISLMPCNLYGPNDNYDLLNSHFLPALIKKIHLAKIHKQPYIEVWGDGSPKREMMHVDDLSSACLFFLNKNTNNSLINIGSGYEKTIKFYVKKLCNILKYNGDIIFNKNMPNGTPRKLLDSSLAKSYGWRPQINFDVGLRSTYQDYLKSYE